ncbi:hypothetical protein TPHA_0C01130 [Tetrapisispora phaffii CBS 4417]|uniref:EXS domain-containing protein n=1 Tax=Tetrapisispora phaffii (strain ATCC 24235 / CBS 4417 / NBRC 1672 / NRRL Y-8282 / UCD 70-5) TaxID=1071381 RepID=G8BR93_TETPH|nr:hypothetical protein TPHA_0C01130 [Tetrapisispora phaffii CBS 4417]CCE62269.1 hypothetical protein TPHA_0C01130 [Tetrapisispora phaffii CBS 4417]
MKFGNYLNESAIPEWKNKYVDYNKGKSKIHIYKHELNNNKHLVLNSFYDHIQNERDIEHNKYSILQRQFITEFIDHWINSYEINKSNNFYLWLLEQCHEKYRALSHQMSLYNQQVKSELHFSNDETPLLFDMNFNNSSNHDSLQQPKIFKNSYDSLCSLLQTKNDKYQDHANIESPIDGHSSTYSQTKSKKKTLPELLKAFLKRNDLYPSYPRSLVNYKNKQEDSTVKVSIKRARRMLDHVLLEFYIYIQLVRAFRDLNATGFRKIVKKFDKVCKTNELPQFLINSRNKYSIFEHADMNVQTNSSNTIKDFSLKNTTSSNNHSALSTDPLLIWERTINKWYLSDLTHSVKEKKERTERIKKLSLKHAVNEQTIHRSNRAILQMFIGGMGIGICLPIIYYITIRLIDSPTNSYLYKFILPLWGSWFLFFVLVFFFLFDCYIWHRNGINYRFIMFGEIHQRNGTQLFNNDFATSMISLHIYFAAWFAVPCAIIATISVYYNAIIPYTYIMPVWSAILMILPFNIIPYWDKLVETRKWLIVGIIRLIFSGFFPVQFGDFFLGVLFCSLTYSLAEIAIMSCISLKSIDCPCSTDALKYVILLSCAPNFWRFCQCLRRLADSGNPLPHLPNAFKYAFGVAFNATFCIYRASNHDPTAMKWFIFCATINAICTSVWDLVMDWSLLQRNSKNRLLRDDLYLAGTRDWKTGTYSLGGRSVYYICMVIDVIIRFQWIVFIVPPIPIQDNPITAFTVAFTELVRRIIWIIFRVENEHVANVQLFKISGETDLPYTIPLPDWRLLEETSVNEDEDSEIQDYMDETSSGPALTSNNHLDVIKPRNRRKSILDNISRNISTAHTSDFQRPRVYSTILTRADDDRDVNTDDR